jgi:hypothetical protein
MHTKHIFALVLMAVASLAMPLCAATIQSGSLADVPAAPMRRPISPGQPMWLIHIDTWNWPDPQKIIDLVPADIRPFVVFNISLSISHDETTGAMTIAPDGYNIAKSWLRTCAENRVWAVVQCASGGFSHFSEYDLSVYEEFYRDYPNFLGWNFAEQFWGFDDKFSCTFDERLGLFTELMKMAHRYGGYLISSFCGAYWGASLNPIAMLKRSALLAQVSSECPDHLIMCEKFTMTSCFHEIESTCLGMWLSGYAGHYGNRFDQCGWNEGLGTTTFPEAAGAIPVLSHMMLTGETVMDGPELIWQQDIREDATTTTTDGYTRRNWSYFPQFVNISIDLFRKVIDGSVRILSRQEVIDRTKVVIVQDINNGDVDSRLNYMTPEGLFRGLYQLDTDGEWLNNITWMKKTGRYPAIPTVYGLADDAARSFAVQIPSSGYTKRWKTVADKVAEMDDLFPAESSGTAYVSRVENAWVCYNPFPNVTAPQVATADFELHYNTCQAVQLALEQFSLVQLREQADRLDFYLTNYRTDDTTPRTDTLRIVGATATPTYTYADRGNHTASRVQVVSDSRGYALAVTHLGPLDLTVNCAGTADRSAAPAVTPAEIITPDLPAVYNGTRQYEAENFDYKNIAACVSNGTTSNLDITDYTGQGYVSFGRTAGAVLRDTVTVPRAGYYQFSLRYSAPKASVQGVGLYVNNARVTSMNLTKDKTGETWQYFTRKIKLNAGANEVRLSSTSAPANDLYFDHILVAPYYDADDAELVDSLTHITPVMTVSRTYLEGFTAAGGVAEPQVVSVSGKGITGAMTFTTTGNFQLSTEADGTYAEQVSLEPNVFGEVESTPIYVRLRSDLTAGDYTGRLTCTAPGLAERYVDLAGTVTPAAVTLSYDFETDEARTAATTPPAQDVVVSGSNTAKAGVVTYAATGAGSSHWLKTYSAGQRNGTGVLTLTRFTDSATDYSVTWRQAVTSSTADYKVGVLLRGDKSQAGTASTGYVQGMMSGYVFIVYYNRSSGNAEFRIYLSTSATSLTMLSNASVTGLNPAAGEVVYYRAAVSGASNPTLTLEYSTDGTTWQVATRTADSSGKYLSGSTQLVWGLAAATGGFCVDDITFSGITYDPAVSAITTLQADTDSGTAAYYNLSGMRVSQPRRGDIVIRRQPGEKPKIINFSTNMH